MNVTNAQDDVASVVRRYAPAGHRASAAWLGTRATVTDLVTRSTSSPTNAAKYLSHLADFAGWAAAEGVPMAGGHLLDSDVIERYIAVGLPTAKDSTRATRRAILRRVAQRCSPTAPEPPLPITYRQIRPPYDVEETLGYLALAKAQPTPSRRRALEAIIHLGLGCGIASRDLAWVRVGDVVRLQDGAVRVTVSGGTRPRSVIALQAHEDALLRLAQAAGSGLLIGGSMCGRRNVTRGPLDRIVGGKDLPRLETARLRSSWLLTHLRACTPLPALMQAAGLTTVRPLEDLLHHCSISGDEALLALRNA